MNILIEQMIKDIHEGAEISLLISGKEFFNVLVEEINRDLLTIRDNAGYKWTIRTDSICAYSSNTIGQPNLSTNGTDAFSEYEIHTSDNADSLPDETLERVVDARIMARRVKNAEMPRWFTIDNIKNDIFGALQGYPAYLRTIDSIFIEIEKLYSSKDTNMELISSIAGRIDELAQTCQEDSQSDCASCCEMMKALLYYKMGRTKYAVSILLREGSRKAAADIARAIGEKYWKAIASYIISYNYTDIQLSDDDRQFILFFAKNCSSQNDALALYKGADNIYYNPDLAFQGALLYLIEKKSDGAEDEDLNTDDFNSILSSFTNTWGPFFEDELHEHDAVLKELTSYTETVDIKRILIASKEQKTSDPKSSSPMKKPLDSVQYYHAPVLSRIDNSSSYSQYWIEFHPMDGSGRQELVNKHLYLNPSQVIDPLLIRHFSNYSSQELFYERFKTVFYIGQNVKGYSAGGAFLARDTRRKILEMYWNKKKIPALNEKEITRINSIAPIDTKAIKSGYRISEERCRSTMNALDNVDSSIFTFLNNVLKDNKANVEIPEVLQRDAELKAASEKLCAENDDSLKASVWHNMLSIAYHNGDSSLRDLLAGYAIGLPESNPYHCELKMLDKIKRGKL